MVLFLGLIIAHLLADFTQPGWLVKWTKKSIYGLISHVLGYTILSGIIIYGYPFWPLWLSFLAITHFIIDKTKYAVSPKLPGWEMPLFLLDQILHIFILLIICFSPNLGFSEGGQSLFMKLVLPYKEVLPYIVGYLIVSFTISIFIFEIDRTLAVWRGIAGKRLIVTFAERLLGMLERTAALTFLLVNNLFFLFPLAFIPSAYKLYKTKDHKQPVFIELSVGVVSSIFIALLLRYVSWF